LVLRQRTIHPQIDDRSVIMLLSPIRRLGEGSEGAIGFSAMAPRTLAHQNCSRVRHREVAWALPVLTKNVPANIERINASRKVIVRFFLENRVTSLTIRFGNFPALDEPIERENPDTNPFDAYHRKSSP
jgi:hypothetical protein